MIDLAPLSLIAIATTFIAAGLVKGVTGMGLPTVAMGVLGAFLSPLTAAGLLIIPSLVTNIWQLLAGPSLRALILRLWPMMATITIGTLGGSALLVGGATQVTTGALGAILVLYGSYTLFARQLQVPTRLEPWLSPLVGLLTGLITGATGVFVIPAVPYLQALGLPRDDLVQALGLSFTVSTLALAIGLIGRGGYDLDTLTLSAGAVIPALLGMLIGQGLRRGISPIAFRRGFLLCLLLLGTEMLLRTVA